MKHLFFGFCFIIFGLTLTAQKLTLEELKGLILKDQNTITNIMKIKKWELVEQVGTADTLTGIPKVNLLEFDLFSDKRAIYTLGIVLDRNGLCTEIELFTTKKNFQLLRSNVKNSGFVLMTNCNSETKNTSCFKTHSLELYFTPKSNATTAYRVLLVSKKNSR